MIVIRRTYAVGVELAKRIEAEAIRRNWDKSQVVQLALRLSLPDIESAPILNSVEMTEAQLRTERDGSIKQTSAKRRSK